MNVQTGQEKVQSGSNRARVVDLRKWAKKPTAMAIREAGPAPAEGRPDSSGKRASTPCTIKTALDRLTV